MGQYFQIANLDKKQVINPMTFGDGFKLMEFGCSRNGTMTGLALLLRQSTGSGGGDFHGVEAHPVVGSWAGDRIAIVGDYDDSKLWEAFDTSVWCDVSVDVVVAMCADPYVREELANDPSLKWKRDAVPNEGSDCGFPIPLDERLKEAIWGEVTK